MKVYVTRNIPSVGIETLRAHEYEVAVNPEDRTLLRGELISNVKDKGYDALLCLLTDKIDESVLEALGKNCKIVSNFAVGVDNIDLEAAKKRGIIVTNTPGVLTEAVAEHTIALLLAVAKRIVEADAFTRAGKFTGWSPMLFLGTELQGKTLGIVGLGRIGSTVAKKLRDAFDMKVCYYDVQRNPEIEKQYAIEYKPLDEVLKTSDFVSLHVNLTRETHHLIGARELKLMKPEAYLINTSRGPVIDEQALYEALRNNTIAGAALDVFENEPQLSPGLTALSNIVLTPHIASATKEAREKMSELAAQNIIEVLEGRPPLNPVG